MAMTNNPNSTGVSKPTTGHSGANIGTSAYMGHLPEIGLTSETSVVVVTHDPKLDDPALMVALPGPAFYPGPEETVGEPVDGRRFARLCFTFASPEEIREWVEIYEKEGTNAQYREFLRNHLWGTAEISLGAAERLVVRILGDPRGLPAARPEVVELGAADTAAALGLMLAERSAHLRHERMSIRLEEAAVSMAYAVEYFMDKHLAGVDGAAQAVARGGRYDRDALTDWLLLYHDIYPDFLTMLSAEADGDIVAATSNMTGFLTPVAELQGHNVADRPYFLRPMSDGAPFIS